MIHFHRRSMASLAAQVVVVSLVMFAATTGLVLGDALPASAQSTWATEAPGWTASGPVSATLAAVSCSSTTTCVAVGSYSDANDDFYALAETLSGGTWTPETVPMPVGITGGSLDGVSCTSSTSCVAVGSYQDSSENTHSIVATLSGTIWSSRVLPDPSGSINAALSAVSCISATCVAVGHYTDTSTPGLVHALIETLSGSTWTATTGLDPANLEIDELTGVSCTATTACTAIGTFDNQSNSEFPEVVTLWDPPGPTPRSAILLTRSTLR